MIDNLTTFFRGGMLPSQHIAARLRICAPETAFRFYPTLEMRTWCHLMPGVLFPFGRLRFPGEMPHLYYGGLSEEGGFFLFVPQSLYINWRRALLLQLAREHLGTTNQVILQAYCQRAEKELAEGNDIPASHPALCAEARARQVSYWARFLAYRQRGMTSDWRW